MSPATTTKARECAEGALRHARKSLLGLIGMGLYFLKAQELFASPGGRPKTRATVARVSALDENAASEGFAQWLSESFAESPAQVSLRTAYNYMRAAMRMGLTADSTEADLAALEASGALAGVTTKQLYAPDSKPAAPPAPPAEQQQPEQLFFNFEAALHDFVEPESIFLRTLPALPVEKLTAYEATLQTALEAVREAKATRKGGR